MADRGQPLDSKAGSTSVRECEHERGMQTKANPNECPICAKSGLFGIRLVKRMPSIVNVFFFEVPTQMESIQLFTKCPPHKRILFAAPWLHVHINISLIPMCLIHIRIAFAYKHGHGLTIQAISCTLFNIESLSHALSTHFKPFYTNLYHIGPSNGTVPLHGQARNLWSNLCNIKFLGIFDPTSPTHSFLWFSTHPLLWFQLTMESCRQ